MMDIKFEELALTYLYTRDKADELVRQNNFASKNANRGSPSGVAYHTPASVIDAVAAWKKAAINLSEYVISKGGTNGQEEKIDPGQDP